MRHVWRRLPDEFVGSASSVTRIRVWRCDACGTSPWISEWMNEGLAEHLEKSGVSDDCRFEVVRRVLED